MSKILSFLLCCTVLFISHFSVSAQKVTKDTWKEFISEEGGFKVKMPVLPKRTVAKVDVAFGKADMIQYRVITSTVGYVIGFIEFPSAIPDEEEIRMRYEIARDGLLGDGGNRLVSDKDIFLGGFKGREFVIQNAQTVQSIRAFIINQKMFTLIAVTQPSQKTKYQSSINKFLDSFALTKVPEAKFEAVKLPDDFGSKTEGNFYQSDFFDFSIELPKSWKVLTGEEMEIVREVVNNEAEIENTKDSKMTKVSLKRTALLAGAINFSEASIMIGAERPDFANMSMEMVIEVIKKNQLASKKEKMTKEVYTATLGGVPFSVVDTLNTEDGVKQRIYMTKRKELIFQIVFTYKDNNDLKTLEESVNTIKFKTK